MGKPETDEPKKKKRHWIRWTVLGFLAVVILLIVFAPSIVSTPWGNDIVRGIIADAVDRPVSMEKLDLGWFSGIEIRNLQISRRDGTGHLLKLERLTGVIGWLPLLSQQLRIGNAKIEGLDIVVTREADGTLNIDDLLGGKPPASAGAAPPPTETAPAKAPPTGEGGGGLGWITNGYVNAVLTHGKITYKDVKADSEIVVDEIHIPIELSKEVAITGASLKINDGPVTMDRIVYGLIGDAPAVEVKMSASQITATGRMPEIALPAPVKLLVKILRAIPFLYSSGEELAGGTLVKLEVDVKSRGLRPDQLDKHLSGTVHVIATGGTVTSSKGLFVAVRKVLGYDSMEMGEVDTGPITIADGRAHCEQITVKSPMMDVVLSGDTYLLDTRMDHKMVVNPKLPISEKKAKWLAKTNALIRMGVLAFTVKGKAADPQVLPDPTGGVKNLFVSIFGKPTSNPFVRDGTVIQRLWDLRPTPGSLPAPPRLPFRLPGTGSQPAQTDRPRTRPAGPPNPFDLLRGLPRPGRPRSSDP